MTNKCFSALLTQNCNFPDMILLLLLLLLKEEGRANINLLKMEKKTASNRENGQELSWSVESEILWLSLLSLSSSGTDNPY